jgi:hypothetical protein
MSEAIERFDQQGLDYNKEQGAGVAATAEGQNKPTQSIQLLELWLDRIEGDPAQLLRNQFWLEEQRAMAQEAGALVEIRPW